MFLCNISLIDHMIQDFFTSLCICFRMLNRIVLRRVLCDTRQCRAFWQIKIPYILIKVFAGGCLHTICSGSEVDRIKIIFKNDIFVVNLFLDFNSQILFLNLTCKTLKPCRLLRPVCKYIILQKLLCNRTCTFWKISRGKVLYKSTENTSYVDTIMLIKTFILDCDNRMLKIHRNLINRYRKSIRTRCRQLAKLIAISII